jgi:glycosyltransferase involved in cell wall biosynthesis
MQQKIDIVLPNLAIGGAEKVMILLAQQFKANGFEVRFIVRRLTEDGFQKQVEKDFELINLNARQVRHFPAKFRNLYNTISTPDIIIASLWPLTFLSAITIRFKLRKTKIICIEHGSLKYQVRNKSKLYKLFLKWSLKLTLRFCDRIVCVSKGLKKELQEITNYKGKKLISIANPIELDLSDNTSEIAEVVKKTTKGHIFLSVGRLKKVKNIPLLLNAFKIVLQKIEATFLILGDGPETENLKKLAKDLDIEENVQFLGFMNNCKPYYQYADTFVLSSNSEGFGNVIVEALMEGCTVVSTDCPYGPKEILDNGKYGYLTEVNNAEKLANNMLKAVDEPFSKELAKERGMYYTPLSIYQQYLKEFNAI